MLENWRGCFVVVVDGGSFTSACNDCGATFEQNFSTLALARIVSPCQYTVPRMTQLNGLMKIQIKLLNGLKESNKNKKCTLLNGKYIFL